MSARRKIVVHYRPAGGTAWCGAAIRIWEAVGDSDAKSAAAAKKARRLRTISDVNRVTCPGCLNLIRASVSAKPNADPGGAEAEEPDEEMEQWS